MADFNTYIEDVDMVHWRELCFRNGTVKCYRKGEPFVWRGEIVKYFGITLKGYFKYTITDEKGYEHITGFVFSGCPVGDFLSIVNRQPVKTDIIAATDAEVMLCPATVLMSYFEESPAMRRKLTEALFDQAYTQYLDLHCRSPKARYLDLLKRCPDILQKITLKELASFLQITPTHLSRIRKELTFADDFPPPLMSTLNLC